MKYRCISTCSILYFWKYFCFLFFGTVLYSNSETTLWFVRQTITSHRKCVTADPLTLTCVLTSLLKHCKASVLVYFFCILCLTHLTLKDFCILLPSSLSETYQPWLHYLSCTGVEFGRERLIGRQPDEKLSIIALCRLAARLSALALRLCFQFTPIVSRV